ncbi:MAG: DNA translocase FtsK [Clostridia bacterium]|nr:DNA translocase FtsK [Clostridia bacterium]
MRENKNKNDALVNKSDSKNINKKPPEKKLLNILMPYILAVLGAVALFSILGLAGDFDNPLRKILFGVFANFATYFIPILLVYHAIMWNYDIKRGICIRRVVCSVITLMCFSTMQYLIQVGDFEELNSYSISAFYIHGMQSQGGGVVGGMIGKLLLGLGSIIGAIIITIVLIFMILQMVNITPAYMIRSMLKNRKSKSKKEQKPQAVKQPKPIKPRKIKVYEEDDSLDADEDEEIPAYLDTTKKLLVDDEDDEIDTSEYDDLDINKIQSENEHIPGQLQPYDEDDEGDEGDDVPEFEISTSKYGDVPFEPNDEPIFEPSDEEIPFEPTDEEEPFEPTEEIEPISDEYEITEENDTITDENEETEEDKSYISDDILDKASKKQEDKPQSKEPISYEPEIKPVPKPEPKKTPKISYNLPPLYFLKTQPDNSNSDEVRQELQENAKIIVDTLNDFKAPTRIIDVTRGPTITRYELQPEKGVRVRTIEGLVDDIALNLAAKGIRIESPIPGKNAIGIEVPNRKVSFVYLRDLLDDPRFIRAQSKLTCGLGKSIAGENIYVDIESTPHLLVAGATGMGKSVCINSLLISLLYKAKPDEVRLILIDPKRVELSNYNGIPHLLVPVVCEPKKSLGALQWAVTEMENRFMTIEEAGVRNITEFNQRVDNGYNAEKMSRIVIVIDELADLKMAVPDIEGHITRLTQKARAAGIHIIIGTQRPSVDVLTGLIKNNIPSRIAFRVPSQVDSRTILDEVGAEKLVSKGDMLVKLVGALAPVRVQGAYVSVDEIQDVIDYWKECGPANYDESVMQQIENNAAKLAKNEKDVGEGDEDSEDSEFDPEFYNALGLAVELGKISSSLLMRKLSLGFQRASRVIDQMEECGYIGEANGPKPRDVLITKEDYQELMMRRNDE